MACRIVLRDDVEAIARNLADHTGITNLTDVVAMMLHRYQDHALQTWRVQATATTAPMLDTTYSYNSTAPTAIAPTYNEPIKGF